MTLQKGIVAVIALILLTTRNFLATVLKNRSTSGNLKKIWFGAKFKGILEQLVAEFTHRVPPLARLQSTTNVKGWSLFFKKYTLLIYLQPSAQITVSTTMSRSINLSWYLSTQGFAVVLLLNRIALFWRLHVAPRPSGPGLLLVQSNLVSIVTYSHVIFFPLGSNEQARLLFSGAFRDSLFRGVYVLTNLQRWYCRFSLFWTSTQRENQ